MNFKKSFTLSEIMIAMTVFGIIAAACIPIVMNMSPNKHAIMIKKAYYTTEQIVSDLINDPIYYPTGDFAHDSTVMTDSTMTGFAKFSCLFAKKLNIYTPAGFTKININDFCARTSNSGSYKEQTANNILFTNDGMVWSFNCDWTATNPSCRIDISTENDYDKFFNSTGYDSANCIQSGTGWGGNICGQTKVNKIGKFAIFIDSDGGISLDKDSTLGNQSKVQNIINGTTSLLGK